MTALEETQFIESIFGPPGDFERRFREANAHLYDQNGQMKPDEKVRCINCCRAENPYNGNTSIMPSGRCQDCEIQALEAVQRKAFFKPKPNKIDKKEQEFFSLLCAASRVSELVDS